MKYLIVNSDDYNLSEGVCLGIVDGFKNGIITSTTFMANLPVSQKSLDLVASSNISAGIHLNLTYGKPLSPVENISDLVNEKGMFYRDFINLKRTVPKEQVFMEIEAQYNRLLDFSIKPDHIDSHHHIHTNPYLKDIFFEFAIQKNLPIRTLNGAHRDEAKSKGITTIDYFCDSFYDSSVSVENLENILSSLPDGISELMCHAGYNDDALSLISSYSENRKNELDILTDSYILNLLDKFSIKLINYSNL